MKSQIIHGAIKTGNSPIPQIVNSVIQRIYNQKKRFGNPVWGYKTVIQYYQHTISQVQKESTDNLN